MRPEQEALLKAFDAVQQTPQGPEADRLFELYQKLLAEEAKRLRLDTDTLHKAVLRKYPRWVRANLPPEFPKGLGFQ